MSRGALGRISSETDTVTDYAELDTHQSPQSVPHTWSVHGSIDFGISVLVNGVVTATQHKPVMKGESGSGRTKGFVEIPCTVHWNFS